MQTGVNAGLRIVSCAHDTCLRKVNGRSIATLSECDFKLGNKPCFAFATNAWAVYFAHILDMNFGILFALCRR